MDQIFRSLQILLGVFLVLTLVLNLETRLPRFPWDLMLDKFGFRIYIPIITSMILTFLISVLLSTLPAT